MTNYLTAMDPSQMYGKNLPMLPGGSPRCGW
jgi:hypothetical protein